MSSRNLAFLLGAILIVLLASLPIISVAIASGIASALGCRLDEGSVHPCLFLGIDIGNLLYFLFVLGWFGIATLPLGAIGLTVLIVLWIVIAIADRVKARR